MRSTRENRIGRFGEALGVASWAGRLAPARRHLRHLVWRLAEPPAILPPLVVQGLKVALASGLAWWLGPFFHLPQPFNAVLAVIILIQGNAYGSLLSSRQFLIGVAVGLLIGIAAHALLGISPLVLAGIMFVCLLTGGWLKLSSQGFNNQIAISALLVLATGSADNISRLWETLLGGAVGVAVAALLWPPNPVRQLRREQRELRALLASDALRAHPRPSLLPRPRARARGHHPGGGGELVRPGLPAPDGGGQPRHERLGGWTDADIYLALTRLWLDLDGDERKAGPQAAAAALLADPAARAPGRTGLEPGLDAP